MLDEQLRSLAAADAPIALDGLEARVLAAIAEQRTATRMAGYAAVVALGVGVASAALPQRAGAAASLAPFWGQSALAPSTLLLE